MTEVVFLCKEGWEHYYDNILPHLNLTNKYVYDWDYSMISADRPAVVVSVFSIPPEISTLIPKCKEAGIAALQLQDGIIEWRHSWDNPAIERQCPPRFRPSLFDKIGVFGPLYRRILESWGNLGKCEIVGAPRWDNLKTVERASKKKGRKFRLLFASARNPGFDKGQMEMTIKAFGDLLDYVKTRPDVDVSWRVSDVIEKKIGLSANESKLTGGTVSDCLAAVDAVICTPSTFLLEAMLSKCPVASLDYHVTPQYLNPAWCIHCKDDIETVIRDMENMSADKMMFQESVCADAVLCDGAAGKRAAHLVHELATWSKEGRRPDNLRSAILEETVWPVNFPPEGLSMEKLFPNHPMFRDRSEYEARAELAAYRSLSEKSVARDASSSNTQHAGMFLSRIIRHFGKRKDR